MALSVLQKITTEYIDLEDRVRLSGELANGEHVVIWLTQRMLQRLLPKLIELLNSNSKDINFSSLMQGFAQQAAQSKFVPQQPVQLQSDCHSWLASSIDFSFSEHRIRLVFRDTNGHSAGLIMEITPLRQWLNILFLAYSHAKWDMKVWPAWFQQSLKQTPQDARIFH